MKIVEETDLRAYGEVPIAFLIESRVDLERLVASNGQDIVETPVEPRWKDYDALEGNWPPDLNCPHVIFAAFEGEKRLGGAIVARKPPGYDLPDWTFILLDIRVHPDARGTGVGTALFEAAVFWAIDMCGDEFVVETQDINVAACRFYRAMELDLLSADPDGYGVGFGEAKLLWHQRLH